MELICPKCGKKIEGTNVNIAQDIAFCAPCGEVHKLSALVNRDPVSVDISESQPQLEQPQAEHQTTGICTNCGKPLNHEEQFCTSCGTPSGKAASNVVSSQQLQSNSPVKTYSTT